MNVLINGRTRVFALFGDPVEHSLSPLMHNRAFAVLELDCCYVPFRVGHDDLAAAVAGISALGLGGVNVTIPHKESIITYLDEVDREATMIGAVNTVVNRDGRLCGYNTDAAGFLDSLYQDAGFEPIGKNAVILGAGGAARAISFALAFGGAACLAIFNRDAARAQILASDLVEATGCSVTAGALNDKSLDDVLAEAELLVNATPIGMHPRYRHQSPLSREKLHPGLLVCDLVYNPFRTRLLDEAAAVGCRVLGGMGMLIYQGAQAFQLWTGMKAPVEEMRAAVVDALQK
jgi:shikimate dehydrogenase